ncbi:uncharacterized protein BJX67DRAFT_376511 [Aspergillus lucknowensis]|uniref:Uncharacterized protein n=1 Tax=Aspergillus lucknowensis TaxID=176173 RepID=A0ABR4M7Y3_9EURO
MPFEFIDNNAAIDRASRKRIRSRAATGKNLNRTIARSSRAIVPKGTTAAPFRVPASIRNAHKRQYDTDGDVEIEIERPVGDGLQFPVPVPPESRYLVREGMYTSLSTLFFFCGVRHNPLLDSALDNPDNIRSVWVRYFFLDEAYFHCSVATLILCSRNLVKETAQGMRHIAHTYRILQERLCGKEATSDMTIAILVIMAQYERLQGQHARGYIHVQGMKRMIELRGGIMGLGKENWGIILKVLRADLEYALQLGSQTLFSDEGIDVLRAWRPVYVGCGNKGDQVNDLGLDSFLQKNLQPDLWMIFSDIRCLATILNDADAGYRQKLEGVEFHDTIILLGYRLLRIRPLGETSSPNASSGTRMSDLENVVHLSLMAFLVTFLTGLDRQVPDKPLLSHRLGVALKTLTAPDEAGPETQMVRSVLLWTLFIGSVVVFKPVEDEWLTPTTQAAKRALGLSSWEDTKKVLVRFPWVNPLHDRAGIALSSAQKLLEFSSNPGILP